METEKDGDFPPSPPPVKEAPLPPIVPPGVMGTTEPALYTPSRVQKKEKSESHCSEAAEVYKETSRESGFADAS